MKTIRHILAEKKQARRMERIKARVLVVVGLIAVLLVAYLILK